MKRIAGLLVTGLLLASLVSTGCAQVREAAKEQVQPGKLAPSQSFTPVSGQGWQKVVIFEGKEQGAETVSFTIPDKRWRINWEATIPRREVGTLSIEVYREDGQLVKEIYQEILYSQTDNGKYSSGEEFAEGETSFYLKTGTRNILSWKVTMETLSPPTLSELEKEYPYLVKVAPGLEGRVAARYRYRFGDDPDSQLEKHWFYVEVVLKNISAKRISGYRVTSSVRHLESNRRFDLGETSVFLNSERDWILPGEVRKGGGGGTTALYQAGITDLNNLEVKVTILEVRFQD